MKRSYNRKYYLHRCIKASGYRLSLETCLKTISILPEQVDAAMEDKYVSELQSRHNYGLQVINPMIIHCEDE